MTDLDPLTPASGARRGAGRDPLVGPAIFLAVGLAYAGVTQAVIRMSTTGDLGPIVWPGAGIALAALLLLPEERWRWVIAAVVVAELTRSLAGGYPVVAALSWTAAVAIEPLIGATLLRRFGNPLGELVPLRKFWLFVLFGVVAAPLLGSVVGALGSLSDVSTTSETVWRSWPQHVASVALGVLAVAPLLLTWRVPLHRRHVAETVAISVGMAVIAVVALQPFESDLRMVLPFVMVPMLTWSALRFGIRGAAVAVFVTTQIAARSAYAGPFGVAVTGDGAALVVLPIFLLVSGCSVFVLAVVVEALFERTDVERQLRTQAHRDDLTGLPNRRYLTDQLRHLHGADRRTGDVSVLACDVDDFKLVNDGFGHVAGDDVLVEVARRLQRRLGPHDLACRLDGNEFVVITHLVGEPLDVFARDLIAAIAEPISTSTGVKLCPSMSIGIAQGPPDTTEALLRDADVALRHAKRVSRGGIHHFDGPLRQLVADRLMIHNQLGDALANGEITAHYQPEIDIRTGKVVCFEALARWDHPIVGPIPPGRFIPIIEDMGAAGDLFALMLHDALDARSHWSTPHGFSPGVAVNLSVGQLADPGLPDTIAAELRRTRTPRGALCLEVTETAMASEPFFDVLLALHHLGIRLAIDDFGTGWSSISRLAAFPWDLLKIDQTFVGALSVDDTHAESVVASTIAMARSLNMRTVAEGVETPYQLERLAQLGCDSAQGFLFSKALPSREATDVSSTGRWARPPPHARRLQLVGSEADSSGS